MRTVGLTGPTGAGKTTCLEAIRSLGGAVFDCDRIYKELLRTSKPMLAAISERFPGAVKDGELDRATLAEIVFSDPEALRDLSSVTHPYVIDEVKRGLSEAERSGCTLAAIDAIGLFESGADSLCDETVFVTAPMEKRIERIMARDGLKYEAAAARARAQQNDEYFELLCQKKIVNNFPEEKDFFKYCREFFQEDTNV